MKCSEAIVFLVDVLKKHGDLEIYFGSVEGEPIDARKICVFGEDDGSQDCPPVKGVYV